MSFLVHPIIKKVKPVIVKEVSIIETSRKGFPFEITARYFEKIEATTKRLEKNEYLSKMLIRMSIIYPEDIANILLLLSS